MKFKFAPRGEYHPGQTIMLAGAPWVIESVAHTGRSLVAHTPINAPKFERIVIVLTDALPIEEII